MAVQQTTDEEYVRAHFVDSHELEGRYGTSLVWLDKDAVLGDWAAAAEFTRERLEQIRQLEAEKRRAEVAFRGAHGCLIGYMKYESHWTNASEMAYEFAIDTFRIARILARLEAVLVDLKRGMKG